MMITDKYPEMISEAIENAKNLDLPKFKFDKIVFCGIGGSLIVGNFNFVNHSSNLPPDVTPIILHFLSKASANWLRGSSVFPE